MSKNYTRPDTNNQSRSQEEKEESKLNDDHQIQGRSEINPYYTKILPKALSKDSELFQHGSQKDLQETDLRNQNCRTT